MSMSTTLLPPSRLVDQAHISIGIPSTGYPLLDDELVFVAMHKASYIEDDEDENGGRIA